MHGGFPRDVITSQGQTIIQRRHGLDLKQSLPGDLYSMEIELMYKIIVPHSIQHNTTISSKQKYRQSTCEFCEQTRHINQITFLRLRKTSLFLYANRLIDTKYTPMNTSLPQYFSLSISTVFWYRVVSIQFISGLGWTADIFVARMADSDDWEGKITTASIRVITRMQAVLWPNPPDTGDRNQEPQFQKGESYSELSGSYRGEEPELLFCSVVRKELILSSSCFKIIFQRKVTRYFRMAFSPSSFEFARVSSELLFLSSLAQCYRSSNSPFFLPLTRVALILFWIFLHWQRCTFQPSYTKLDHPRIQSPCFPQQLGHNAFGSALQLLASYEDEDHQNRWMARPERMSQNRSTQGRFSDRLTGRILHTN